MEYLLSQEEYDKLRTEGTTRSKKAREQLQRVCTLAAENVPVKIPYIKDRPEEPWGCILTEKTKCGYCDHCPVQRDCPSGLKSWSK